MSGAACVQAVVIAAVLFHLIAVFDDSAVVHSRCAASPAPTPDHLLHQSPYFDPEFAAAPSMQYYDSSSALVSE